MGVNGQLTVPIPAVTEFSVVKRHKPCVKGTRTTPRIGDMNDRRVAADYVLRIDAGARPGVTDDRPSVGCDPRDHCGATWSDQNSACRRGPRRLRATGRAKEDS